VSGGRRAAAGVVFALPVEAGRFADLVSEPLATEAAGLRLHEGRVADRDVAWVVAGVGVRAAARACRLLVDGHRPRLVIAAGFAGALADDLARGEIVCPWRAARVGEESIDLVGLETAPARRPLGILSVDRVVCSADEKRRLGREAAADLVDMETWAVAREARDAGLPCACLRVVSDTADEELPREVARLAEAASPWRRLGLALGTLGRRPAAVGDLWRLWEQAVVDSRSLADALERGIAALPPTPP